MFEKVIVLSSLIAVSGSAGAADRVSELPEVLSPEATFLLATMELSAAEKMCAETGRKNAECISAVLDASDECNVAIKSSPTKVASINRDGGIEQHLQTCLEDRKESDAVFRSALSIQK